MMKTIIATAAILFCSAAATSAQEIKPIALGTEIPMAAHSMKTTDMKAVSISSEKKENGVLVLFSCNTCPYVIKNESRIKKSMAVAAESGIGVIVVNSNEAKRETEDGMNQMVEYAKKQGFTCAYAMDHASTLADAFGATRTPEAFLFDKNNKLVYHGAIDDSPSDESAVKEHYLNQAMRALKAGKKIKVAETKSVGCSIKRAK